MFDNRELVKQNETKTLWWNIIQPKDAVFIFGEFLMCENVEQSRV